MEIISDKEEYEEQMKVLWHECFGETKAYLDYYMSNQYRKNKVLMIVDEDAHELISMLHINPIQFCFGGYIQTVNYIIGVATKPKYQGQGLMKRLMTHALKQLKEEGNSFVLLMTDKETYYDKFGFHTVMTPTFFQAAYEKIGGGNPFRTHIKVEPFSLLEDKDNIRMQLEAFAKEELPKQYDAYGVHDDNYFKELQQEVSCQNGDILVIKREEKVVGYAAYVDKIFDKRLIFHEMLLKEEKAPAIRAAIEYYFAGREHGAVEIVQWREKNMLHLQAVLLDGGSIVLPKKIQFQQWL